MWEPGSGGSWINSVLLLPLGLFTVQVDVLFSSGRAVAGRRSVGCTLFTHMTAALLLRSNQQFSLLTLWKSCLFPLYRIHLFLTLHLRAETAHLYVGGQGNHGWWAPACSPSPPPSPVHVDDEDAVRRWAVGGCMSLHHCRTSKRADPTVLQWVCTERQINATPFTAVSGGETG